MRITLNKHDTLWGRLVRERDKRCLYCGKTENLQAHHIFGRSRSATRFLLENGITLCPLHHTFSTDFSAHRTEQTFRDWAKKRLGPKEYSRLEKLSYTVYPREKAVRDFLLKNS